MMPTAKQSAAAARLQRWRRSNGLVKLELYLQPSLKEKLRSEAANRGVAQAQLVRYLIEQVVA